jgi:hypothetical protein
MSVPISKRFGALDPTSQQIIQAILAAAENAKKASIATRPVVVGPRA